MPQNPEDLTESDILDFLDSLDIATPIEPGEVTAGLLAQRRGIHPDAARDALQEQVKLGKMTCRQATDHNRRTTAYRLVKPD
jgi:hypothetical protein